MKKSLAIILILTISSLAFAQQRDSVSNNGLSKERIVFTADTLRIQNMNSAESNTAWFEGPNTPWVFALVISIAGLTLNLIIANKQIKNNNRQQIRDIKATLNTSNRQTWLNELRNTIADFATCAKSLNVALQNKNLAEKQIELHERFSYNLNKLLLLLKEDKRLHKSLIDKTDELLTIIDSNLFVVGQKFNESDPEFNNAGVLLKIGEILKVGRDVLYDEWATIQSISDSEY